ncbi:hypothetical protein ACIA8O_10545 [Kitasatospora sp. NPDC051853]|uniref:hypothetical protein n=1 Tax=Kitasatospora sp. NPDC051853 TaxID=3364058 RepID=UPI00379E049A
MDRYGPLRRDGDRAVLGGREPAGYTPYFTPEGVGRQASGLIPWAGVRTLEVELAASPWSRALEGALSVAGSLGSAPAGSLLRRDSVLRIGTAGGERLAWWFGVPRVEERWHPAVLEELFTALGAAGRLAALGGPELAGVLAGLPGVRPFPPGRRRSGLREVLETALIGPS